MIPLTKESKEVYDVEWTNKQMLLLKGIGKYCKCGCKRHIFSKNPSKVFASASCRRRYYSKTKPEVKYHLNATLSLKLIEKPIPHYNLFVYPMKKGLARLTVPIYENNKELWNMCSSFAKFRIKSKVELIV